MPDGHELPFLIVAFAPLFVETQYLLFEVLKPDGHELPTL